MRVAVFVLSVVAGCASLEEYTPREDAAKEEVASCGVGVLADEARLAAAAAIATVEPFTVLISS